jgi:hypothetical protein
MASPIHKYCVSQLVEAREASQGNDGILYNIMFLFYHALGMGRGSGGQPVRKETMASCRAGVLSLAGYGSVVDSLKLLLDLICAT